MEGVDLSLHDGLMDHIGLLMAETSRENANIGTSPAAKMLQIGSAASRQYYLERLIPSTFASAHRSGDIHIHDLDFYSLTLTCVHIPLGRLLACGFNTGHGFTRPPRRPASAAALAAIIIQSSQNDMHGGQSYARFDTDMADYVGNCPYPEALQAMEAFVYNLNTMHSRAGAQVPFSSVNLGCDTTPQGRQVTRALLEAYGKGLGRGETPVFPNIIFRVKRGVNLEPGDPNHDLLQNACAIAARRMNPTFSFMDAPGNEQYGDEVAYMGCRTRVISNRRGPEVSDGRGNLSFTSINLPRLALRARGDVGAFMSALDSTIGLAADQLLHRFGIQARARVRDMPFLMGQGLYIGSGELGRDDEIRPAIVNGTLSIGFIGLAEALIALTGHHHGEDDEAQRLGTEIVGRMRKRVDELSEEHDLNFSLLGTPAEGLSGRFVALDRAIFGVVPGVTDREFYTNSFHVPVWAPASAWHKISVEGPYHRLCNAGHISYVEFQQAPEENWQAVYSIVRAMSRAGMGYGGVNFPLDECRSCGASGTFAGDCPACGSADVVRLRRITGYLAPQHMFNPAKQAELESRRSHV